MTPGGAPRGRFGMNARLALMLLAGPTLVVALLLGLRALFPHTPIALIGVVTVFTSLPALWFVARKIVMRGLKEAVLAVSDGLLSLTERDYGLRLVAERRDEVGLLVHRFNVLAEALRRDRNEAFQKEILLETILHASSTVVVICNEALHIVYSNAAARQFFGRDALEGELLADVLAAGPPDLQEAAGAATDVIFTCDRGGDAPETFFLTKRFFEVNKQKHTVFLLRPMTRELARKEADTWKKAIRVISHEMNNSLAPISSLLHSARLMAGRPEMSERLGKAFDTIDERVTHLKTFLDGYASFARLPRPTRRVVPWRELLTGVEGLYRFRVEGDLPPTPADVDPAQMQQVLINLIKNAVEAGGPAEDVTIAFEQDATGAVVLEVRDRGKGMAEDVLKNALLPFYSTKKSGTGLGLPLCREIVDAHGGRLSLHPREGGGTVVRCWFPPVGVGERAGAAAARPAV